MLIGFGRIGAGYADDPAAAEHFPYITHAQVLRDHPAFELCGVCDHSETARLSAQQTWKVPCVTNSLETLEQECRPELAVIATPPSARDGLLGHFRSLQAVVVEKPLGLSLQEAESFVADCRARDLVVQVNLWRRADEVLQDLAGGGLTKKIGPLQAVSGVYGNGLLNNGTHLVDLVRMLAGEVAAVQVPEVIGSRLEGPLAGDANLPFLMFLTSGVLVAIQPVSFVHYREIGLTFWGEQGRLDIMVEGLVLQWFPAGKNRAVTGEREIPADRPKAIPTAVGQALWRLYDNLAESLNGTADTWSPAENALCTAAVVEAIMESSRQGGTLVEVENVHSD